MDSVTIYIICFLVVMSACALCYSWGYKDGRKPHGLPVMKNIPPPPPEKWTAIQSEQAHIYLKAPRFYNPLFSNVWHFKDEQPARKQA